MAQTVLVVDDQDAIVRLVTYNLEQAGYRTLQASDGVTALEAIDRHRPDLVVLDLMLPELDGLEVCRRLRARGDSTPIIMLTARGEEVDRVVGLELGADDYLAKPFSPRELVARVRSVLRRSEGLAPSAELRCGSLLLNVHEYSAAVDGRPLGLSPPWVGWRSRHAAEAGDVSTRAMTVVQRLAGQPAS